MLTFIILFITTGKVLMADEAPAGCLLDVIGNAPKSPMVTDIGSSFRNPVSADDRRIFFEEGEILFISCPGGGFNFPGVAAGTPLKCQSGTNLATLPDSGQIFDFAEITCTLTQRPSLTDKMYANSCENGGTVTHTGYTVNNNFAEVFSNCFDTSKLIPFYAAYTLTEWANELSDYTTCSYVINTYLFNYMNAFDVYDYTTPELEALGVVGYATADVFLALGQLAPYEDFFTSFQRDATFQLTNVAPRWNTFSEGNWASLAKSIRRRVQIGVLGAVTVYAGTLGVATLPDSNNASVELYLRSGKFPVPKWFWKLIYSRSTGIGYIFFGYNNPFETRAHADDAFRSVCTQNVFNTIGWIDDVDNDNARSGFLYACPVDASVVIESSLQGIISAVLPNT